MYIKNYKVRYAKTGEIFEREFTVEHYGLIAIHGGLSVLQAFDLVNQWNRQNATSGFTYWIE